MSSNQFCVLRFSQRQEAVRRLRCLRMDDGDGQHAEWYAGVDACIHVLNMGLYAEDALGVVRTGEVTYHGLDQVKPEYVAVQQMLHRDLLDGVYS